LVSSALYGNDSTTWPRQEKTFTFKLSLGKRKSDSRGPTQPPPPLLLLLHIRPKRENIYFFSHQWTKHFVRRAFSRAFGF
jgi:hypothetical protein